jgi:hypothetical protein
MAVRRGMGHGKVDQRQHGAAFPAWLRRFIHTGHTIRYDVQNPPRARSCCVLIRSKNLPDLRKSDQSAQQALRLN